MAVAKVQFLTDQSVDLELDRIKQKKTVYGGKEEFKIVEREQDQLKRNLRSGFEVNLPESKRYPEKLTCNKFIGLTN